MLECRVEFGEGIVNLEMKSCWEVHVFMMVELYCHSEKEWIPNGDATTAGFIPTRAIL